MKSLNILTVSGWVIFIVSIALGILYSPWFFLLTAFIGCSLLEPDGSGCCSRCFSSNKKADS